MERARARVRSFWDWIVQHQDLRGGRGARGRGAAAGQLPWGPAAGYRLLRPSQQVHRPLQRLQRQRRLKKVRNADFLLLTLMQTGVLFRDVWCFS